MGDPRSPVLVPERGCSDSRAKEPSLHHFPEAHYELGYLSSSTETSTRLFRGHKTLLWVHLPKSGPSFVLKQQGVRKELGEPWGSQKIWLQGHNSLQSSALLAATTLPLAQAGCGFF